MNKKVKNKYTTKTSKNIKNKNIITHFIYNLKHKRYFRILCLRWALLLLITLIAIPVTSMIILPKNATAVDSIDDIVYKYYITMEIQPGDSLWSIAEEYKYNQDSKDYIKEVKHINHLYSNQIIAGQKITIPYYSTIFYE